MQIQQELSLLVLIVDLSEQQMRLIPMMYNLLHQLYILFEHLWVRDNSLIVFGIKRLLFNEASVSAPPRHNEKKKFE